MKIRKKRRLKRKGREIEGRGRTRRSLRKKEKRRRLGKRSDLKVLRKRFKRGRKRDAWRKKERFEGYWKEKGQDSRKK